MLIQVFRPFVFAYCNLQSIIYQLFVLYKWAPGSTRVYQGVSWSTMDLEMARNEKMVLTSCNRYILLMKLKYYFTWDQCCDKAPYDEHGGRGQEGRRVGVQREASLKLSIHTATDIFIIIIVVSISVGVSVHNGVG